MNPQSCPVCRGRCRCPVCHGTRWIEDPETGKPLEQCSACHPALTGQRAALKSPDKAAVWGAIVDRARAPGEFTIEDALTAAFGDEVSFGNVAGAVTNVLARAGIIVRVGYRPARRASRAGAAVAVWVGGRVPATNRPW